MEDTKCVCTDCVNTATGQSAKSYEDENSLNNKTWSADRPVQVSVHLTCLIPNAGTSQTQRFVCLLSDIIKYRQANSGRESRGQVQKHDLVNKIISSDLNNPSCVFDALLQN